jgi:phospholipid/cholesterol/gamma-HCH transport system substrate-binding protein
MPRTRSIAWSELKLGIIGIVTFALIAIVIVAIGGQGGFPWERYPLKVRFDEVGGLKTGAVVQLNGKEIGKVASVEFAGAQIDVTVEVSRDVRPLITTQSTAALGSVSLLGEPNVDVTASNQGTPLDDWAYIQSDRRPELADLTATASASLEQVGQLVSDLRQGRGTMGRLLTDPVLYDELRDFAASASTVAGYLREGEGTLGRLMRDPAAYEDLRGALERLRLLTEKINTGEGTLARLLNDPAIADSIGGTMSNMERLTNRMNQGEGTLGQLLTDDAMYRRFTDVATRLEGIMSGVDAGEGTVGSLLKDQELYENMNQAASELRTLIAEIRADPRKYLNVRVSIF